MIKRLVIVFAVVLVVALPFVLRPERAAPGRADETLVIITPHNEAIRSEFGRGFAEWYRARTGKTVYVDWRVIGGTSEITRFLEGEYTAAFQNLWTRKLGKPWSNEVLNAFQNGRPAVDAPPEAKEARETFLKSEVSCGIDLFFGGGPYDFIRQAQSGRIVASGVLEKHPEWFRDDVIPREFAGEEYWDLQGRWIGTVLSSYGILSNHDSLQRLGVPPPQRWDDLKNPRLAGEIALADPTKSSSIAKAFENVIQEQMQRRLLALRAAEPSLDAKTLETRAVSEGWMEGMRLMQIIGANSRYFTDTSQKPPIDVAQGNSAVGMCIDFYGRQQEEAVRRRDGSGRLVYVTPKGGSVSSVDPIALLRGAPNRELAVEFIEYVLSMDGQKLWNFKVGTPGGPERFALRRLPVRRDFYTQPEWKTLRSDPNDAPYGGGEQLVYRPAWTGGVFREMAFVIRVMCLDTHPELTKAWRAIAQLESGRQAEALAVLQDVSRVSYEAVNGRIKQALNAKNKTEEIRLANELANAFRQQYLRARAIADAEAAKRP
jgi:iron(III) transport system substrate-binding protein